MNRGAFMADLEHLRLLKQGIEVWNQWRSEHPDITPDFSGADLRELNLFEADLRGANLRKANLGRARLDRANLTEANLVNGNLAGASLIGTIFDRANLEFAFLVSANLVSTDLKGARLCGADLRQAHLQRANLMDADLTDARVGWGTFGNVDLSVVQGLEKVNHAGPSTIGIDTGYRSCGKIPEAFLRGAGVPDEFIIQVRSLVGEYYSCFISHSSQDKRFCERLHADLQTHHVLTWYFPKDAHWGESVWGEIDHSILVYDKVVAVCSKNSLQSGPVLREIERALNREDREGKSVLFPIRIDNYIFEPWEHPRKADILAKVVGDFSGWARSPARYGDALQRLLRDLKAGELRS
jgi:hypothetical protein